MVNGLKRILDILLSSSSVHSKISYYEKESCKRNCQNHFSPLPFHCAGFVQLWKIRDKDRYRRNTGHEMLHAFRCTWTRPQGMCGHVCKGWLTNGYTCG